MVELISWLKYLINEVPYFYEMGRLVDLIILIYISSNTLTNEIVITTNRLILIDGPKATKIYSSLYVYLLKPLCRTVFNFALFINTTYLYLWYFKNIIKLKKVMTDKIVT